MGNFAEWRKDQTINCGDLAIFVENMEDNAKYVLQFLTVASSMNEFVSCLMLKCEKDVEVNISEMIRAYQYVN